ncbi:MAG TPA: HEAT repeat domain-containing protein [Spirochaetota bacterium]|nr:HEAT repeat domain-containing protein [Spirochaetota bacterium]
MKQANDILFSICTWSMVLSLLLGGFVIAPSIIMPHRVPGIYSGLFWIGIASIIVFVVSVMLILKQSQRANRASAITELRAAVREWKNGQFGEGEVLSLSHRLEKQGPAEREILIKEIPTPMLHEVLRRDILPDPEILALAIAETAARHDRAALPLLRDIYRDNSPEMIPHPVRRAIMRGFETTGNSRYASFLVGQLNEPDGDVLVGVIRALATCGTVKTVEPLFRLGRDSMNPFVRTAAKDAIDAIQARLGTVDAGWLSLPVEPGLDGALSAPATDRTGSLSHIATKRKRRRNDAMSDDKTINKTIGRIVTAAIGVVFMGFFITLLSRGESAGFVLKSLFRIPFFHVISAEEFPNCEALMNGAWRRGWKVLVYRGMVISGVPTVHPACRFRNS